MRIGPLELSSPFALAAMSEITTAPARLIAREAGASLGWTPMVSAELMTRENPETAPLLEILPGEGPVGLQLVGAEPEKLAACAARAKGLGFAAVDLNASCPARRMRFRGAGSALMRDPRALGSAVRAIASSTALPVTVKLRLGEDDGSMSYLECAAAAVESGAGAVFLHARTAREGYSAPARWEHIRRLAGSLRVPVGGSGSVGSARDAVRMLSETGCSLVLVGRGATGNPWIFGEAMALAAGRGAAAPSPAEVASTMRRHYGMLEERLGGKRASLAMRSLAGGYLARVEAAEALLPLAARLAGREDVEELCRLVERRGAIAARSPRGGSHAP